MLGSLIGMMACCSSRSWILRWASIRRNTRRLRICWVSLRSPLGPFPFFLLVVDSSKGVGFCDWLLLDLGLSLCLLLLPFYAPRVCCFFSRRGKILACRLLLLLLGGLLLQDINFRFWLGLVQFVSMLFHFRWLLRLLHIRLNFCETNILCILVGFVRAAVSLQSLSVSQSVQCVVSRWRSRVDACDHNNFRIAAKERVSQHHWQLGRSERNVTTFLINCSYALFQSKQALIDLRTLHSSLPVVTLCVSCSFWTSQVNKQ